MFVKPRSIRGNNGSKPGASLFLVVAGAIVFVHMVQSYVKHMVPIVSEQRSKEYVAERESISFYDYPCGIRQVAGVSAGDSKSAHELVQEQVDAIKSRQYDKALELASADYQKNLSIIYSDQLQSQYPELYSSSKILYGSPTLINGNNMLVQPVEVDADSVRQMDFTFMLVKEAREWRVNNIERGQCYEPPANYGSRCDHSTYNVSRL